MWRKRKTEGMKRRKNLRFVCGERGRRKKGEGGGGGKGERVQVKFFFPNEIKL